VLLAPVAVELLGRHVVATPEGHNDLDHRRDSSWAARPATNG
jgi:hypothetical protein